MLLFVLINLMLVLGGYLLYRHKSVGLSWLLMAGAIAWVCYLFIDQHPVISMLAIIATTFNGMKVVAAAQSNRVKSFDLSLYQWLNFAIGWVGMRADLFNKLGGPALPNAGAMIRFGISRVLVGALLLLAARYMAPVLAGTTFGYVIISIVLLVGLSLILHFGLLGISAGIWRLQGVNTYFLFREPAKAVSLTEFWSKRWNLAFSEMTSITLYRPLKPHIGRGGALMMSFLFSGLLHELALSIPVHSGYGLPTLYFLIQGLAVLAEQRIARDPHSILHHKAWGKLWLFCWLVLPAPLLFHPSFIEQVVWPIVNW